MKQILKLLATASTVAIFTGCSLFGSHYQILTVCSDPDGADVMLNGFKIGKTPLQHKIRRRGQYLVELRKDGYNTVYTRTDQSLSAVGTVDVVAGAFLLVPLLGMISPAAWEQNPSSLGFVLYLKEPPAKAEPAEDIQG